jgi:hypothetical protein
LVIAVGFSVCLDEFGCESWGGVSHSLVVNGSDLKVNGAVDSCGDVHIGLVEVGEGKVGGLSNFSVKIANTGT